MTWARDEIRKQEPGVIWESHVCHTLIERKLEKNLYLPVFLIYLGSGCVSVALLNWLSLVKDKI